MCVKCCIIHEVSWFKSQLVLNDFDSTAITGMIQLCISPVFFDWREGERGSKICVHKAHEYTTHSWTCAHM